MHYSNEKPHKSEIRFQGVSIWKFAGSRCTYNDIERFLQFYNGLLGLPISRKHEADGVQVQLLERS